jgi:glycosyltransferase 2 family protein
LKRLIIATVKIVASLAIVAFLVTKAKNDQAFAELWQQPKDWARLGAALMAFGSAVMLTHIRWYYLVRGLELPLGIKDAFRLGFLGYLFNLAPTGVVGGDLLKGVMLVRHVNGHKAKATASVLVDRLVGLYMLFVVASVAMLVSGFTSTSPQVRFVCWSCVVVTAVGGVGLMLLFTPGVIGPRTTSQVARIPRIGPPLGHLLAALRLYHHRLPMLFVTTLMSAGVHLLFTLGIYLTATALYDRVAPLGTQLVLAPLAASTGALPLPMGPFEAVLEFLYSHSGMPLHQGLIVALAYRIASVLIAAVGMAYYFSSRAEIEQDLESVESEPLDGFQLVPENSSQAA